MESLTERDDLIRRSDVMESANRHRMYASANRESVNSFARFIKELDSFPAVDAVEVCRCRDCKNWETDWEPNYFNPDNPRHYCGENDLFPTGDWFCKDGKRREERIFLS